MRRDKSNQDGHGVPRRTQHLILDLIRIVRFLPVPLKLLLAVRERLVEARGRLLGPYLVLPPLVLVHVVLGRGVDDQALLVARLEAEQVGDVRREQPVVRVVHGQRRDEVGLRVAEQLGQGAGRGTVQAGGLVDDEGLVVVLEVVDGSVLRGGDVDAHGHAIGQFVEGGQGREGREVRAAFRGRFAHLGGPCLDVGITFYLRVGVGSGILYGQHLGDVVSDLVPHTMNAAGVCIVVILSVIEELRGEAPTAEVIRDVLAFEVKVLVRMFDEVQSLWFIEADKIENHIWHERVSSCGVEGQSFLPVRVEKPENEMVRRQSPVCGHND